MKSTTQQPPNSVMANLAQMNTVFASQGGKKRPSASPQASGSNSPKGMKMDSGNVLPLMMPVACPECHLDFPKSIFRPSMRIVFNLTTRKYECLCPAPF